MFVFFFFFQAFRFTRLLANGSIGGKYLHHFISLVFLLAQ